MRITAPLKESGPPSFPSNLPKKNIKLPGHPSPVVPPKSSKLAAPPQVEETLIFVLKLFG